MYVSVLMPTHNRQAYVGQAIESVLKQTHSEFELIIVDDSSTDATRDVIEHYAGQDRRIRAFYHAKNEGVTIASNECLELAKYDLIARIDDDDVMRPNRLQRQIEFMDTHRDVTVASSWVYLIDEAGRIIGQSRPRIDLEGGMAQLRPELFLELIQPATIFRRQDIMAVGGYRAAILEDRDLWGRVVTAGYKLAVQPEFLTFQRRHKHSLMTTDLTTIFERGDFIDFNVIRRLRGDEELTFEQYLNHIGSLPLSARLARARKRRSGMAFRRASTHYSGRNWFPLAGNLALALALEPIETAKRLGTRYVFKSGDSDPIDREQVIDKC